MLTNHHCFATTAQARDTEVWFNYECAVCGGFATLRPTKVPADKVLATGTTLDYTLFSVQNFGAIQDFGYLTIDDRDPPAGEELYIPQHPAGVPTVIAMNSDRDPGGNCQVSDPTADGYAPGSDVSYYCDTAGGSSGSPVLSRRTNRVIALHHFGGCPNAGVRIDLIYRQIAPLL
jgi:lysyl endopeptidase